MIFANFIFPSKNLRRVSRGKKSLSALGFLPSSKSTVNQKLTIVLSFEIFKFQRPLAEHYHHCLFINLSSNTKVQTRTIWCRGETNRREQGERGLIWQHFLVDLQPPLPKRPRLLRHQCQRPGIGHFCSLGFIETSSPYLESLSFLIRIWLSEWLLEFGREAWRNWSWINGR